jgi:type IV pilus assembly protein PilE
MKHAYDNRSKVCRLMHGFTLVEVIVTLAIVAILASLAYGAYQTYVRRSHRSESQAVLLQASSWLERIAAQRNTYLYDNQGNAMSNTSLVTVGYSVSPNNGAQVRYNVTFAAGPTATTYTLQAVPINSNIDPTCGTSTLDQNGTRSSIVNGASLSTSATTTCWGG